MTGALVSLSLFFSSKSVKMCVSDILNSPSWIGFVSLCVACKHRCDDFIFLANTSIESKSNVHYAHIQTYT